jgi:hypothetical protein
VSGSPVSATVVGGENMSANLKRVLSDKGKAILARANAANAKQFAALVRQAVPQDPKEQKHLVDTVDQRTVGEIGSQVSIGNADVPYPLHLETGHRDRAGNTVAARAYWFPAKRVVQKQIRARTLRSYRAAIKAAFPKPSE